MKLHLTQALLVSMDEQVEKLLLPIKTDEVDQQKPSSIDCDPEVEGNPVAELNDLCGKIKRQPPEYEDIETEGKPHERLINLILLNIIFPFIMFFTISQRPHSCVQIGKPIHRARSRSNKETCQKSGCIQSETEVNGDDGGWE